MMMFFPIAPRTQGSCQKLHMCINRLLPKDFPRNRGDGKRAQQGIEISRRTEEIGKNRKLPARWMLSHSISSSISPSKRGVAWANDVHPFCFVQAQKVLSRRYISTTRTRMVSWPDTGIRMSHSEDILERLKQAMKEHFR